ncbi:MAG: branched-chain amino acid ABC transporter permease [Desulfobacterales bacterium]|nr:branched-chain amino acid ABC transporter permease [Desulfobacterales bacterium]
MQNTKRLSPGWVVLAIIAIGAPYTLSEYKVDVLTMLLVNIILVASFRLITTTGGWSLAHIPMMGAGAYATALLTNSLGLPFLISLPLSSLAAGLVGLIISYPLSRTKGFSFFVASFAAGEAIRLCWIRFKFPFGGHRGLSNIQPPRFIPSIDFSDAIPYYFLTLVVTIISLMILYRVDKSRIGKTFKSIESQEDLANSLGIYVTKYKMLAFAIGSCFAGTAGVMLAHRLWAIEPHQFGFMSTLYLLVWVVFGGTHTFSGPIIGVVVMTVLGEILRPLAEWIPMVYGSIIILTLIFLPEGLEGLRDKTGLRLGRFGKIKISFEK